jgi:hypothetical protein
MTCIPSVKGLQHLFCMGVTLCALCALALLSLEVPYSLYLIVLHSICIGFGCLTLLLSSKVDGKLCLLLLFLMSNAMVTIYGAVKFFGIDMLAFTDFLTVHPALTTSSYGIPQFILLTLPFVFFHRKDADGWVRHGIHTLLVLNTIVLIGTIFTLLPSLVSPNLVVLGTQYVIIAGIMWLVRSKSTQQWNDIIFTGCMGLVGYGIGLLLGGTAITSILFFWLICGMIIGILNTQKQYSKIAFLLIGTLLLLYIGGSVQLVRARLVMKDAEQYAQNDESALSLRTYQHAYTLFPYDRSIIIASAKEALHALENTTDTQTRESLDAFVSQKRTELSRLTGAHDGMAPLLHAWQISIMYPSRRGAIDSNILTAQTLMQSSEPFYDIAGHIYEILGDTQKLEEIKTE